MTTVNQDGTQTTTTTVTTTITNADGTKTSTTQTTSTTSAGGTNTSVKNINTGQVTNTATNPTQTTTTQTSTTEYDANGNIVSTTTTDPTQTIEEPTDPNCASCVPEPGNYVNPDYSVIDQAVESFKTVPDVSGTAKPTLSIALNSGGICNSSDFQFTLYGVLIDLELCTYIAIMQSILYWLLYIFVLIYGYTTITNLGHTARK